MKLRFGLYKDVELADVPTEYLLAVSAYLRTEAYQMIDELTRRGEQEYEQERR